MFDSSVREFERLPPMLDWQPRCPRPRLVASVVRQLQHRAAQICNGASRPRCGPSPSAWERRRICD